MVTASIVILLCSCYPVQLLSWTRRAGVQGSAYAVDN